MAQFLGTVQLGGFYNNGTILKRPTKPWRPDSEPVSGVGVGDIPQMSGSMANYTLGNTPSAAANKLQWHKIKDGDKILLNHVFLEAKEYLGLVEPIFFRQSLKVDQDISVPQILGVGLLKDSLCKRTLKFNEGVNDLLVGIQFSCLDSKTREPFFDLLNPFVVHIVLLL